jgi:hypothetical protein
MNQKTLKLLTAAEAEAYVESYKAFCVRDNYTPPPGRLEELECDALTYYKVAGWYVDVTGPGGCVSLHKPLGDGEDDMLCGSLAGAIAYAEANPL